MILLERRSFSRGYLRTKAAVMLPIVVFPDILTSFTHLLYLLIRYIVLINRFANLTFFEFEAQALLFIYLG